MILQLINHPFLSPNAPRDTRRYLHHISMCFADCTCGSGAELTCQNDTLTVTWSTDITFDATLLEIPTALYSKLTQRLIEESRFPILYILLLNQNPLYVWNKLYLGVYSKLGVTFKINRTFPQSTVYMLAQWLIQTFAEASANRELNDDNAVSWCIVSWLVYMCKVTQNYTIKEQTFSFI